MTAPTLRQVMAALETRLDTIAGLRVSDTGPGQIVPPAAIVGVPEVPEYRLTMGRGSWRLTFAVTVLVGAQLDRVGQLALADFADVSGSKSIAATIEADKTLGGVVSQCWVEAFRPLGIEEVGAIGYFGGVWAVNVVAPGT